jgi:putative ABC transport system substrate-binding protein
MISHFKRISVFIFSIFLFINLAKADLPKKLAISQIVAHPTLDKVRLGIIDGLKAAGFTDHENIIIEYQNANGNMILASQIAKKFVSENNAVIIAITTPSAQTVANVAKSVKSGIPIIFATVTDPIKAKLVSSYEHPGGNITGTSNPSAISQQLALLKKFLPDIKSLGLAINFSEVNSVELLSQVKQEAKKMNIEVVTVAANNSSDVPLAAKNLASKVQAVFLLQDNTIASALPAFMKVMNKNNVPVFASFMEAIDQGAVAAVAYDEYQIGIQTGNMVARVLNGTKPRDIPVESPIKLDLVINKEVAQKLNLQIPLID